MSLKAYGIGEANTTKNRKDYVMNENENLVTEEVTENVEQTTEETPRTYTDNEVNDLVGKKLARNTAKLTKKYDREYGELIDVLKAGMGKEDIGEITRDLRDFYTKKNITIPNRSEFSDKDIDVLAKADAEEIIKAGNDEVNEEVDRLAEIGANNMTDREKSLFKTLAEHRQRAERVEELAKIGVTEDVYNSKEFQDFSSKFNSNIPITEIYDFYAKTQPKKDIKPMGSMKNNTVDNNGVKDFYSFEEASKFTKEDFDKNPALFKAVEKSMTKWK